MDYLCDGRILRCYTRYCLGSWGGNYLAALRGGGGGEERSLVRTGLWLQWQHSRSWTFALTRLSFNSYWGNSAASHAAYVTMDVRGSEVGTWDSILSGRGELDDSGCAMQSCSSQWAVTQPRQHGEHYLIPSLPQQDRPALISTVLMTAHCNPPSPKHGQSILLSALPRHP